MDSAFVVPVAISCVIAWVTCTLESRVSLAFMNANKEPTIETHTTAIMWSLVVHMICHVASDVVRMCTSRMYSVRRAMVTEAALGSYQKYWVEKKDARDLVVRYGGAWDSVWTQSARVIVAVIYIAHKMNLKFAILLGVLGTAIAGYVKLEAIMIEKFVVPRSRAMNIARGVAHNNASRDAKIRADVNAEYSRSLVAVRIANCCVGVMHAVPIALLGIFVCHSQWRFGLEHLADYAKSAQVEMPLWRIGWDVVRIGDTISSIFQDFTEAPGIMRILEEHKNRAEACEFMPSFDRIILRSMDYIIGESERGGRSFRLHMNGEIVLDTTAITCMSSESGNGKSTFAGFFCDDIDHDGIGQFSVELYKGAALVKCLRGPEAVMSLARVCCHMRQEQSRRPTVVTTLRKLLCDPDEAEAMSLLRAFGLDTFRSLDDEIDVSPGQWDRILLVRTLLRDDNGAQIVILDEPIKAIDKKTAALVVKQLASRLAGRIVILITHNEKSAECIENIRKLSIVSEGDITRTSIIRASA